MRGRQASSVAGRAADSRFLAHDPEGLFIGRGRIRKRRSALQRKPGNVATTLAVAIPVEQRKAPTDSSMRKLYRYYNNIAVPSFILSGAPFNFKVVNCPLDPPLIGRLSGCPTVFRRMPPNTSLRSRPCWRIPAEDRSSISEARRRPLPGTGRRGSASGRV